MARRRKWHPLLLAVNRAWQDLRSYEVAHKIPSHFPAAKAEPVDERHAALIAALREASAAHKAAGRPTYEGGPPNLGGTGPT